MTKNARAALITPTHLLTTNGTSIGSNLGYSTPTQVVTALSLDNVNNTSDANKPISTATQAALNNKAATSHTHAIANITGLQAALDATSGGAVTSVAGRTGVVTLARADVGLGNADNTSDANKPVSTATTTALAGKADLTAAQGTLTYAATTNLDLTALNGLVRTLTLTGNVTFTTSNRVASRSCVIRLLPGASSRTLAFPDGWVFLGAAAPTSLAANKTAVLSVTFFGTADTDAVCSYAVQP